MSYPNKQLSVTPQCQIVLFSWEHEVITNSLSFRDLAKATPLDVSPWITTCSFQKSLGAPAGSISFTLENDRDWKQYVKPGQWCLIYMSNDGDLRLPKAASSVNATIKQSLPVVDTRALRAQANRLRAIGYIERVGVKGSLNEAGGPMTSYVVTGRDFGVVYEETSIWQNFFLFESGFVDAAVVNLKVAPTNTADNLLKIIHQLFYSPSDIPSFSRPSLTQVGRQWLLPRAMLDALGVSLRPGKQDSFYGHISGLLQFSKTEATVPIENPMSTLNGNAWEKLRTYSVQQFHELFPETDATGKPRLFYRPIPWGMDPSAYPRLRATIPLYKDFAAGPAGFDLPSERIHDFDLGEDNHARYNHFLTIVQTTNFVANDNITLLKQPSAGGRTFPFPEVNSIARHGFRPMHAEVNSLIQFGTLDGKADPRLLVDFNEVLYDYWNNAIFFESGTMRIEGTNEAKLGRVVRLGSDVPYNAGKVFYLEGYTDEYAVGENKQRSWTQTLVLTRGTELAALRNFKNPRPTSTETEDAAKVASITKRSTPFNDNGTFNGDSGE